MILLHSGCTSEMFCFALRHHHSETSWAAILAQGRKVCDGVSETQEVSGSTEEFPPGLYFTAVPFSWVKWEQKSTALRYTDIRPQYAIFIIIPGANSLGIIR